MDTIGKYKLVRVIGEGGMGRVYEAIDPIIGRRVAIKTISLNVGTDADILSRFFRVSDRISNRAGNRSRATREASGRQIVGNATDGARRQLHALFT
jgi:serine/threonine protein kinase